MIDSYYPPYPRKLLQVTLSLFIVEKVSYFNREPDKGRICVIYDPVKSRYASDSNLRSTIYARLSPYTQCEKKCLSKFSAFAIDRWFAQHHINQAKTTCRTSQDTFPSSAKEATIFRIQSSSTNASLILIGRSQFRLHTEINLRFHKSP